MEDIKLDWLEEFVSKLPDQRPERKNFFGISGYPHWEEINSNFLAFYFDPNEDHNFKTLFLKSLLDLIGSNENKDISHLRDSLEELEIQVDREAITEQGRVDLVISNAEAEDSDWAIIIENKLTAEIHNDFEDYYNSFNVEDRNKFGVLLTLDKVQQTKTNFLNITHEALIQRIRANLPDYFDQAHDRHLIFLKEFFANIESFYKQKDGVMEKQLKEFHENGNNIQSLKKIDNELLKSLNACGVRALENFGLFPVSSKAQHRRHFYFDSSSSFLDFLEENEKNYLLQTHFWLGNLHMRYNPELKAGLKLKKDGKKDFAKMLKDKMKDYFVSANYVSDNDKESQESQIVLIKVPIDEDFLDFEELLKENLDRYFFKAPEEENNFLKILVTKMKEVEAETNESVED